MPNVLLPTIAIFLGLIVLSLIYIERENTKYLKYSIHFAVLYILSNIVAFWGEVAPQSQLFGIMRYVITFLPLLIPTLLLLYAAHISKIKAFASGFAQMLLMILPGLAIIIDILVFSLPESIFPITTTVNTIYFIGSLFLALALLKSERKQGLYFLLGVYLPVITALLIIWLVPRNSDWQIYSIGGLSIVYSIALLISLSFPGVLLPKSILFGKIKTQVYITFVSIAAVIILMATGLTYSNAITVSQEKAQRELEIQAHGHMHALDTYFSANRAAYTGFVENNRFIENEMTKENQQKLTDEIRNLIEVSEYIHNISIHLPLGVTLSGKPIEPLMLISKVSPQLSIYKDAQDTVLIEQTFAPNPNTKVVFYLPHEKLEHIVEDPESNYSSIHAYLIDESGTILTNIQEYQAQATLGMSVPDDILHACNESTLSKKLFTTNKFGSEREVIVSPIPNERYCIVISISTAEINEALSSLLTTILVISLITLICTTFAAEALGTSIAKPISALNTDMLQAAEGQFPKPTTIKIQNEIGTLAQSFNTMVHELQDLYESFESKVKKQTGDLIDQRDTLIRQQKQMVHILSDLENEKSKTELLAEQLKKFELAVQNSTDHIVITDPNGIVLFANQAVKTITGFAPNEVIGQKVGSKQNWGGQMDNVFYKKLWKTLVIDKKSFQGEIVNIRKNGQQYYVYASITPILDKKGTLQFFVAIERDITKEKNIDKVKTEFVSLASHQLRTPLSAINWYTEMLLDEDAGAITVGQKEYLSEIYEGTQRMIDLVGALLNVSRLELGSFSIEPETVDIIEIAEKTTKELTQLARDRKVKIIKKYEKPAYIMSVDKKLMYIILQNVLSNAIKYNKKGGTATLTIQRNSRWLTISVSDTGMGIPESEKSRVFEKLFRASNAREKVIEGTGLGLYIIKSILEAVGGSISFESTHNVGTIFTIRIPAKGMRGKQGAKKLEFAG